MTRRLPLGFLAGCLLATALQGQTTRPRSTARTPRPTALPAIDRQAYESLYRAGKALQAAIGSSTPASRDVLRGELGAYRAALAAAKGRVANASEAEMLEWYRTAETAAQSVFALLAQERQDTEVRGMSEDIARTIQAPTPTPLPEGSDAQQQREAALLAFRAAIGHAEALLFHRPTPTPVP